VSFGVLAAPAQAQCVNGTITSEIQVGGPYDGLYKYTIAITWSTNKGLSHVTLDCNFGMCPAEACAADWYFDDPAGSGTVGIPVECEFDMVGEFNCDGDASIGLTDPVLKWDAIADTTGCEPDREGTATMCFYTSVAPVQHETPVVLVKNGQNVCQGTIVGACPLPCATPVQHSTWGRIKHLFN